MFPTTGSTLRGDLNIKVEEAALADTFFIADKVLPAYSVALKSGQYPKIQIAAGELMTSGSTNRAPDGSYGEVSRSWTYATYDTQDRGIEERVDDADQKDLSRFFNLEATAARLCLRNMKIAAEVRAAAAIMNASTFTDYANSAVAYTSSNLATINFPLDVLTAIERVNNNGADANTIVMSPTVFNLIRRATLTLNWVAGSVGVGATVTASTLAKSFSDSGITNLYVGRSRYNSAKKGQAYTAAAVWGDTYVWVGRVTPTPGALQEGGCGYTLVWNAEGGLYVTESYRDETRRSNMVRVRHNTIEKIVDASAATLITTQYSA